MQSVKRLRVLLSTQTRLLDVASDRTTKRELWHLRPVRTRNVRTTRLLDAALQRALDLRLYIPAMPGKTKREL